MDQAKFESMVAKLETESRRSPTGYQFKVGMLALLGFCLILLIMSFAGLALLLIGSFAILVLMTGGKALLLLVKLGKLLILLAIPCWMLIRSSLSALFVRLPKPQGIALHRKEAPVLFAQMDAMRKRMKGPQFHQVLITDDVNAAVVQRPMFGLFGFQRNYLILGLPLMESISPEEMLAVVAHEYGHLAGLHGRFNAYIYRLRNTWGTIQDMSMQWGGWVGQKLHGLVSWYAPYFNAYTFVLARVNEYQADAASAELAGHAAARSALKRVNIASAYRERFMEATYKEVSRAPEPPDDLAIRWAGAAPQAANEADAQTWLADALKREPHFADTHPALAQRLEALSQQDETREILPPALNGSTAAEVWLGPHAATLRTRLQEEWHSRIMGAWKERHVELQAQIKRLATLRTQVPCSEEEQIEMLRLQLDLEPESNNLAALAAFNAEHADRPLTLFWEASLRLDANDETGLALLDHVMTLDASATKAACEKAYNYLLSRNPERALAYEQKWHERNDWEHQRHAELESLDMKHPLVPAQLDEPLQQEVEALLKKHSKGIAKVWLARRELPSDPEARTYVIGIKTKFSTRLLRREEKVMTALIKTEWPLHAFICNLRHNKVMRVKLEALKNAEIRLAS